MPDTKKQLHLQSLWEQKRNSSSVLWPSRDFTWDEMVRLFGIFGYAVGNKGKTSGSRAIFVKGVSVYMLHKPHPGNTIIPAVMSQVLEFLKSNDLI